MCSVVYTSCFKDLRRIALKQIIKKFLKLRKKIRNNLKIKVAKSLATDVSLLMLSKRINDILCTPLVLSGDNAYVCRALISLYIKTYEKRKLYYIKKYSII